MLSFFNIFLAKITFASKITIHRIIKAMFGLKYDNKNFAIVMYRETHAKIIDLHVDFAFQLVNKTTQ
jgi:hypothetical protein